MIDIVDELVERVDTLLQPALDPRPLFGRHDARDQVEGKDSLRSGRFAVHIEGDAQL